MEKPQGFIPKNWTWIQFEGPEAADFLQRLSTARIPALKPGQGTPACFLTPQGRLLAYFQLWRLDPLTFAFEFDAGQDKAWEKSLLEFIEFYTFSEKFKISKPKENIQPVWLFPKSTQNLGENEMNTSSCRHSDSIFGRAWISSWKLDKQPEKFDPIAQTEIESWRMNSLTPRADSEIRKDFNPLEVGLRSAVADNKGCYPGQEVIEKIVALGAPARRLCLLETQTDTLSVGSAVTSEQTKIGQITSAVGSRALAILNKTLAVPGLTVQIGELSATILKVAPYEK